jgi:hypothetical protein
VLGAFGWDRRSYKAADYSDRLFRLVGSELAAVLAEFAATDF